MSRSRLRVTIASRAKSISRCPSPGVTGCTATGGFFISRRRFTFPERRCFRCNATGAPAYRACVREGVVGPGASRMGMSNSS